MEYAIAVAIGASFVIAGVVSTLGVISSFKDTDPDKKGGKR